MKSGHKRAIVLVLIVILALSTAGAAFADGPPDPKSDVCKGDWPPFGTAYASCQHHMGEEAPNGPWAWGPLGP